MADLRTPLYDWHRAHGARMVPFGGWEMPVQYSSLLAEHQAVRNQAGLFDISHMGRLNVTGVDADRLVDRLFTHDPLGMKAGRVRYGFILNQAGGILDDILVTRWAEKEYDLVVNASNRDKILAHIGAVKTGLNADVRDDTLELGMIAVQGPQAVALAENRFGEARVADLRYYTAAKGAYQGASCVVSRTGYTGEDGFEVILPAEKLPQLADELLASGVTPCGLGARDSLRLEAGMPLYGHELNENIDPIRAGLGWAVKPAKGEFVGRDAIVQLLEAGTVSPVRVGLELEGKRAAREGSLLMSGENQVGHITSGSFAPSLGKSIAMGYVSAESSSVGSELAVDIRGSMVPAKVVELPFYRRR